MNQPTVRRRNCQGTTTALLAVITALSACDQGTPLADFDTATVEIYATYTGNNGVIRDAQLNLNNSDAIIDLKDDNTCPHLSNNSTVLINGIKLSTDDIYEGGMIHHIIMCDQEQYPFDKPCNECYKPSLYLTNIINDNFDKFSSSDSIEIEIKQNNDTISFSAPLLKNFDLATITATAEPGARVPFATTVGEPLIAHIRFENQTSQITDCPNPLDADSDDDGVLDGANLSENGANNNTLNWVTSSDETDTDNDSLSDSEENTLGTNPLAIDTDEDGLTDAQEASCENAGAIAGSRMFLDDAQLSFIAPPYIQLGTARSEAYVKQDLPVTCSLKSCTALAATIFVTEPVED